MACYDSEVEGGTAAHYNGLKINNFGAPVQIRMQYVYVQQTLGQIALQLWVGGGLGGPFSHWVECYAATTTTVAFA